jgi:hypothetical protein
VLVEGDRDEGRCRDGHAAAQRGECCLVGRKHRQIGVDRRDQEPDVVVADDLEQRGEMLRIARPGRLGSSAM